MQVGRGVSQSLSYYSVQGLKGRLGSEYVASPESYTYLVIFKNEIKKNFFFFL